MALSCPVSRPPLPFLFLTTDVLGRRIFRTWRTRAKLFGFHVVYSTKCFDAYGLVHACGGGAEWSPKWGEGGQGEKKKKTQREDEGGKKKGKERKGKRTMHKQIGK